ncbi:MAG: hypothetical protein RL434_855, partial [Pseudomonadota bacterium]
MFRWCFLFSILLSQWVFAATVENLRVWHSPDQTRLVLDLSAATRFDVFTVKDPDRLVIDLAGAAVLNPLALPSQVKSRIRDLRYAPHNQGRDLRLVLELSHALEMRKALLPPHPPYGHRLVVDLIETDAAGKRGPPAPKPTATPIPLPPPPVMRAEPVATRNAPVAPSAPAAVLPRSEAVRVTAKQTVVPAPAAAPPRPANPVRTQVIAIDAGHGGDDVGAIGMRGTYEKDVVLAIARELARQINAEPGFKAVLIRDGDYFIDLRDRMVRARRHRADMFVSIHADAFQNRRVTGSSVYVLSNRGATSEAARWLAERENAADLVGGVTLEDKDPQLRSVLLDLSQTASLEASLKVAENVLHALKQVGEVHREQVQAAGFMVLKSPDIPSLLVETAFISNPSEEQQLRDHRFRVKIAGAVKEGIKAYFRGHTLPGQRYAN